MNKTHIPCNSQNAERTYEVLSYYFNKKDSNLITYIFHLSNDYFHFSVNRHLHFRTLICLIIPKINFIPYLLL
jgi:hypothetical protein